MKHVALLCFLLILLFITAFYGKKTTNTQPVIHWIDKDISKRLNKKGVETSLRLDMKDYSSILRNFLIINGEYLNPQQKNRRTNLQPA